MQVTIYKNVPDGSGYEGVIEQIGKCLAAGGRVEFEHRLDRKRVDQFGLRVFINFINAKLFWDKGGF